MRERIKRYLAAPAFEGDLEKTLLAQKVHIILLVNLLGTAISIIVLQLTAPERLIRVALLLPVLLFLIFANRRGYGKTAAILLIAALWLLLTYTSAINGGVLAPAAPVFVVIILFVALLFGIRAALAMAFVCALTGLGLYYAEVAGLLHSASRLTNPLFIFLFAQVMTFYATVGMVYLAIRDVREALKQAQRELSERHRIEAERLILIEELGERNTELEQVIDNKAQTEGILRERTDLLNHLNLISRSISTLQNPDNVYESIYEEIRESLKLDFFYIALYNPEKNELTYPFIIDQGLPISEPNSKKRSGSFVDRCIVNSESILIKHSEDEMEKLKADAANKQGNYLGAMIPSACLMFVPMIAQSKVVGVMSVQSYSLNAFDEDSLAFLSNVAFQAAIAIENARLFEALQVSETLFKSAFHASPLPYCITILENGLHVDVNDAYLKLLQFKREEVIGVTTVELDQWGSAQERALFVKGIKESRQIRNKEDTITTRSGEKRNVLVNYDLLLINGEFHILSLFEDITDRKIAEQDREKFIEELGRRNAELERFTYTVSHDLKSPLVTIKGFLGMLKKDMEENKPDRVQKDFDRISNAAEKMGMLLSELLELSRIGRIANPPTETDLTKLVNKSLETLDGRIRSSRVTVKVSPNLPSVYGDQTRLREVFENLVDNAAKYMGDQKSPLIEIGHRNTEDEIIFFVKDNGLGIDPKYHSQIFGLFEKLDSTSEGTGIGLALIKRIVEVHGGRIWVESDGLGKGSTFCFTIPDGRPII